MDVAAEIVAAANIFNAPAIVLVLVKVNDLAIMPADSTKPIPAESAILAGTEMVVAPLIEVAAEIVVAADIVVAPLIDVLAAIASVLETPPEAIEKPVPGSVILVGVLIVVTPLIDVLAAIASDLETAPEAIEKPVPGSVMLVGVLIVVAPLIEVVALIVVGALIVVEAVNEVGALTVVVSETVRVFGVVPLVILNPVVSEVTGFVNAELARVPPVPMSSVYPDAAAVNFIVSATWRVLDVEPAAIWKPPPPRA